MKKTYSSPTINCQPLYHEELMAATSGFTEEKSAPQSASTETSESFSGVFSAKSADDVFDE